jgi:hypothetical protein
MKTRDYILLVALFFSLAMHLGCASPPISSCPTLPVQSWVTLPEDKDGFGTQAFYAAKAVSYFEAKHPDLDVQNYQLKSVFVRTSPKPAGVVKVVHEGERRYNTGEWSYPQIWVFMNADATLRGVRRTTVGYMKSGDLQSTLKKKESMHNK